MRIEVPDEYLPLVIKALDNQHVASHVLTGRTTAIGIFRACSKKPSSGRGPDEKRALPRRSGGRLKRHQPRLENKVDNDCNDDLVKLVRYQVMWIARDHEAILQTSETVVADRMDAAAFVAGKIAEFTQNVAVGIVDLPTTWRTTPRS